MVNTLNLYVLKNFVSATVRKAAAAVSGRKPTRYPLGTETPIQTFYDGKLFDPFQMRVGLRPIPGVPPSGLPPYQCDLRSLSLSNTTFKFVIDPSRSFFGDCINAVDAPLETALDPALPPFGWSGKALLGGYAMTASALSGEIICNFRDQRDDSVKFDLDHAGGLQGSDSALFAPDGYFLKSVGNVVRNAEPASRGKLNLNSGQVFDFHYNVIFWNSAIERLLEENPGLTPPPLLFPGPPHAGHAMAWIAVNPTSRRLELGIAAEQFLPLGSGSDEAPIMFPASESGQSVQESFPARNSSLHPFIFIFATGPEQPSYRPASIIEPSASAPNKYIDRKGGLAAAQDIVRFERKTIHLTCLPTDTNFGDDFALRSDHLGGSAMAQSPLFGELIVQFGKTIENHIPFVIKFDTPSSAFRKKFAKLLSVLPPGTSAGLVGMCGKMSFPKATYFQRELSLNSDPYNLSIGIADVRTGRCVPAVMRKYLFQNVMESLLKVEPRTPTDSFAYLSAIDFLKAEGGHTVLRLTGEVFIPYPAGYAFPLPNGRVTRIEKDSYLRPFVNLFAIETEAFARACPNLNFQSQRHVRGLNDPVVNVSVRSASAERIEVEISCDGDRLVGKQCRARTATVGNASVVLLEFIVSRPRKVDTDCYCVLTHFNSTAEFQMISVDESLDLWVSGACDTSSFHVG